MTTPRATRTEGRDLQNWLRLVAFLKPYRGRFAAAILFALLNAVFSVALMQGIPLILGTVFQHSPTEASVTGSTRTVGTPAFGKAVSTLMQTLVEWWNSMFGTAASHNKLTAAIVLFALIMMSRALTDYLSKYFLNWVGIRIITDMRHKAFERIQSLSLDFYNKANVGDLISRLVNDCQQAQSAVTTVIADLITQPFTVVLAATALIGTDWRFSLAAVVLAPLCAIPISIYGRKVRRTSKLSQENQGEIVSHLHENITGVRVVKAFQMEKYESAKFWETCYRQFSYQMRIVRSVNILSPLIEVVATIGACAALVYAFRTGMAFENLMGLLFGIYLLYNPIKNLSKLHTTIQKSMASTDRVFMVLDAKSSVVEASNARHLAPIRDDIRLDDVSFRYDAKWVLQNVSLTIPHGKTIALVGPSGAGKTTLLNMLPRFYDPASGAVKMDGVDIREASLESLRRQIAIVTQDTILFHDTIRNNIRYGSLDASEEKIIEASKRAHAHDFILHQPHGYDTIVGDKGIKLSGGQKQRLAIARAILKDPSILLLDEATSALDAESERHLQAALEELIRGRTVVVIAHRLSTVQHADVIVVMEHGRIVEQGRHDELLAKGSLYRKLYDLQFREA